MGRGRASRGRAVAVALSATAALGAGCASVLGDDYSIGPAERSPSSSSGRCSARDAGADAGACGGLCFTFFDCVDQGPCAASFNACQASHDCVGLTKCLDPCVDKACIAACVKSHPSSYTLYMDQISCELDCVCPIGTGA